MRKITSELNIAKNMRILFNNVHFVGDTSAVHWEGGYFQHGNGGGILYSVFRAVSC